MMDGFSEAVQSKARSIPAEDIDPVDEDRKLWRVRSARTGKMHTVQIVEGWITCSCQHGRSNGGQAACYHACRAVMERDDEEER